jgi:glycerol-3-phosphate dehydrogenase
MHKTHKPFMWLASTSEHPSPHAPYTLFFATVHPNPDPHIACAGDLSRNRTVGLKLGRGMKLPEIIESMHGAVAEGVLTSRAAHDLAKKLGVDAPIIDGIHKVIHGASLL